MTAPSVPPARLDHAAVRRIFLGLMLAMFLSALDQTIVATALATIGRAYSNVENLTWVVTASSGAANITPSSATGPLSASFDLIVGGFITFTVTGNIDTAALGTIVNTVEVFPPPGTTDPDADNVATDQVPLVPVVNVTVDKDDGVTTVVDGPVTGGPATVLGGSPGIVVDDVVPEPGGGVTGPRTTVVEAGGSPTSVVGGAP